MLSKFGMILEQKNPYLNNFDSNRKIEMLRKFETMKMTNNPRPWAFSILMWI
jgi:hypothetical protein